MATGAFGGARGTKGAGGYGGGGPSMGGKSGGGAGGLRGISRTRAGVLDAEGREVSRTGGGGPNSANAAIGTYSQGPAQPAAYGGMLDPSFGAQLADAIIGALPFINRTTKVNPVSGFSESTYSAGALDGLGSILGGMMGAPGLGMFGGYLDDKLGTSIGLGTHTYGDGWGGQTAGGGGGYSGGGAPGMGGGRGGGYVARGGQGGPAVAGGGGAPAAARLPAVAQMPSQAMPWQQQMMPGYTQNTRFGQGTIQPYGLFG